MEEALRIFEILKKIKEKIYLQKGQTFAPSQYNIFLGLQSRHLDSIAYMDYDPEKKQVRGQNAQLYPKIDNFLRVTNNHHLLEELKQIL